jgi:methanogenic corrinoid protein MtbC1
MDNARRDDGSADWRSIDTASGPRGASHGHGARNEIAEALKDRLASVIEGEIIPRLMLAHKQSPAMADTSDPREPLPQLDAFVDTVLGSDPAKAFAAIDALRSDGVSVDRLFLGLLAPAARQLGDMWEADLADFMDVTVGLSRLQQVLRELTPRGLEPDHKKPHGTRRILLVPAPGERHTFGLSMVEKFFRSAGWDVVSLAASPQVDAVALARRESFAVVGLSLSCETGAEALSTLIRRLRKATRNDGLGILVGGDYFVRNPEKALMIGADATAVDGPSAVSIAQSLLDLRARAC